MCRIECVYGEESVLGKYGSNFKYGGKSIKISDHIRGLKSVRYESSYIDFISVWKKETNDKVVGIKDFGLLTNYIQFFSDFCEFTDEFINKHNVEKYHISLIRHMYFDYNDDEDGNYVTLGYKRPYGNSHVYGDIAKEYLRFVDVKFNEEEDDDWAENNEALLLPIHMRAMGIFDFALEELDMPLHFENKSELFRDDWKVSNIWLRTKKIDKLTNKKK